MCLVAAVAVAGFGYGELEDLYWLQHRGEVVQATVLDEYGFRTARIEVRFVTRAGETVTGETANYVDAEVGRTIDVVYDREDPSRMQAADWGFDYWIPAAIFGAGTVLFLGYGLNRLWRR
ncbi:DUF3592 domain-containing protein [Kribbella sp. NPDC050124]|uniref:DUF3592 domain-containing protein n=1 Tax=Kribbella sp. NPDC050124 TaxID=3364114 RepID=UPI0037A6E923